MKTDYGVEITVEGIVQGVGFREFTRRTAVILGLRGVVLNLADGRVRCRAEGSRDAIESLTNALRRGPAAALVRRVDVAWSDATGRYTDFRIVHSEPAR